MVVCCVPSLDGDRAYLPRRFEAFPRHRRRENLGFWLARDGSIEFTRSSKARKYHRRAGTPASSFLDRGAMRMCKIESRCLELLKLRSSRSL